MAYYTMEKLLYFAHKKGEAGLHRGPKDRAGRGTDLGLLLKTAVGKGYLTLNKETSNGMDDYYNITAEGVVALRLHQLAYQFHNSPNLDRDTLKQYDQNFLDALNNVKTPDFLAPEREILIAAASMDGYEKVSKKGPKALRYLNTFNLLETMPESTNKQLTRAGRAVLDTLERYTPKNENTLAVDKPKVEITQSAQTPPQKADAVSSMPGVDKPSDYRMPVRQAITLRELFAGEPYFEYDADAPPAPKADHVPFEELLSNELLDLHARDDAYTYYKMSERGQLMVKGLEMLYPNEPRFSAKAAQSSFEKVLDDAPMMFDINMSYQDYAVQLDKSAKLILSEDGYQGLNDFYYDVSYANQVPIRHALRDLHVNQNIMEANSPSSIRVRHQTIKQILANTLDDMGEGMSKEQVKYALSDNVEKELGIKLDAGQLEHYYTSNKFTDLPRDPVKVPEPERVHERMEAEPLSISPHQPPRLTR